jgi:nicotinamidase-related amidase
MTGIPPSRERSGSFLDWLDTWYESRPSASLARDVGAADDPARIGIVVVDLLVGFCSKGALASPRIGRLVTPTAAFLRTAWAQGIRSIWIAADSHPPDSPEFRAFPPHCITGTAEAELEAELGTLPFAGAFRMVPKGSLNVWLDAASPPKELTTWIVVGDCTDLCVYHAAMHLRMEANARGLQREIWVPAALVDTYDLPVATALGLGALPHDGDLMHRMFLYQLALNGIHVVRELQP